MNLHSVATRPAADDPVRVTHRFLMAGREVERSFTFDRPQRYTIECPAEPADVSIRLEIPSDR